MSEPMCILITGCAVMFCVAVFLFVQAMKDNGNG